VVSITRYSILKFIEILIFVYKYAVNITGKTTIPARHSKLKAGIDILKLKTSSCDNTREVLFQFFYHFDVGIYSPFDPLVFHCHSDLLITDLQYTNYFLA
jgi:hypothetical protein